MNSCLFAFALLLAPFAHADLILTRAVETPDVVVQKCDARPAPTCAAAGTLTLKQLKRIERQVAWRGYLRMLSFSMAAPLYAPFPPNAFLYDYLTFVNVSADLRNLLKTPGVVRINEVDAGFNDVYQLITRALPAVPAA